MPTIAEVRAKYPQYNDLSDEQLADALHRTFYSDMPKDEFLKRIGGQTEPAKPTAPTYSGSIIPMSRDAAGNRSFDSNAGLLGAIKRAVTLPGDVYQGKVDPRSDEAIGRAAELAALASPINPGVRAGEAAIPGVQQVLRRAPVKPPTAEALKTAGARGFDTMREMGVDYRSNAVAGVAQGLRANLERDGITQRNAPSTYEIIGFLEKPPAGSVAPLSGLDQARRELSTITAEKPGTTDGKAARRALEGIEGFIQNPDPASVVAGPAAAAGRVLRDARSNYAAGKRSERLNRSLDSAELQAASTNSGQNLENLIRGKAKRIVDPEHPERASGFTQGELQLIRGVAEGGINGTNTLRFVGNLLGGGGGLGMLATASGGAGAGVLAGGGPLTAAATTFALPALGYGLKSAATRQTKRAFTKADEAVRKRSPLYERMRQEAPLETPNELKRAALIRALLLAQQQGGNSL